MRLFMAASITATCLASRAFAGAGIAGADILKVPVEARGWGLACAYSAIADDVGAMAYNPAGLALATEKEIRFTHLSLLENSNFESLLAAIPLGRWGTLGGMFLHRSVPTIDNGPYIQPPMGVVEVSDTVLGMYTAFRLSHVLPGVRTTAPLSMGAGFKQISMKIGYYSTSAAALDFGLLLLVDPFRLALAMQNFGGGYTFIGGSEGEADPLPQTMRTAVSWAMYEDTRHSFVSTIENASYIGVTTAQREGENLRTVKESSSVLGFGIEYWRLKKMSVRIGYMLPWSANASAYSGSRGIAMGGTFRIFTDWLAYQIDMAYRPIAIGTSRQDAFSVSLGVRF